MIKRVDQIVISASPGDAITSMALDLRESLRREFASDIFALTIVPQLRGDVRSVHELPPTSRSNVVLYHASYGEPEVTDNLLRRKEHLVMVYHNMTPSRFFMGHSSQFAAGVQWGRYELDLLRDRFDTVLAVSPYNARDLEASGYTNVRVLPLGLRPGRLASLPTDLALARAAAVRFPAGYAIAIAQQLPHKRLDTILHAMHVVRAIHGLELGLVVVGPERLTLYSLALRRAAAKLRLVEPWFTGSIDDRRLATLLGGSVMFLSASEHEGLSLPPLEAMASCVPVIVRGTGAVPETVGDAAIVLPESAGPLLFAEAIVEMATNDSLRSQFIVRGIQRVAEIERQDPMPALRQILQELN